MFNLSAQRRLDELRADFSSKLVIKLEGDVLGLYEFGTKTAKHHFCKRCGIYTFHQTRSQLGFYRINIGCIEGIDPFSLETDLFDGKNLL